MGKKQRVPTFSTVEKTLESTLTWVDHDQKARDQSLRVLAFFHEKESRDELGLGGIRDSLADQFFPGTSTIQTRLRYMLFVPWIYQSLEKRKVPAKEFALKADRFERSLTQPLLETADPAGVFGRVAGNRLKRLPSSVYWAGLLSWGIRVIDLSQDEYHRHIDSIYRQRENRSLMLRESGSEIGEVLLDNPAVTWHPKLPDPPTGFPFQVDFVLTEEEVLFLLDRICQSQPNSLLAHLALKCGPADVEAPWLHPERATFSQEHRALLDNASKFSDLMHGAALLYNLALSEHARLDEMISEYQELLSSWSKGLNYGQYRSWSLDDLWQATVNHGYTITPATRSFVKEWLEMVLRLREAVSQDRKALELIRRREMLLKGPRSRFINRRALDQWGGASGTARLVYRWPNANVFLKDLKMSRRRP